MAQQRNPVLDHGGAHEHGAVEELGSERVDEGGVHEVDVVAVGVGVGVRGGDGFGFWGLGLGFGFWVLGFGFGFVAHLLWSVKSFASSSMPCSRLPSSPDEMTPCSCGSR